MRLRFTIRDLLWLTLVVAIVLGWAIDHWRKPGTRYRLVETEWGLKIIDNKTEDIWLKRDEQDSWSKVRPGGRYE